MHGAREIRQAEGNYRRMAPASRGTEPWRGATLSSPCPDVPFFSDPFLKKAVDKNRRCAIFVASMLEN